MPLVNAILGLFLLLFGRPLYWAFVAIAGFLLAGRFAEIYFADYSAGVQLLIALAAGILGAVIAIIAQRVAFALAGAYAGGYLALGAFAPSTPDVQPIVWIVIGAVIGGIIAAIVMDWAIIGLSSLVGAWAIATSLPLGHVMAAIAFLVLLVIGVVFQSSQMDRYPNATGST